MKKDSDKYKNNFIELLFPKDSTLADNLLIKPFGEQIKLYMKERKVTVDKLSERTGISIRTIEKMRAADDSNNSFLLSYLVAFCIGLHLEPMYSFNLIERTGRILRAGNIREYVYIVLLNYFYDYPLDFCNEILKKLGFPPLTRGTIISPHDIAD